MSNLSPSETEGSLRWSSWISRVLVESVLVVEWVTRDDHSSAQSAVITANRRKLSLIDCTSFVIMRRLGLRQVFTFDAHFAEQGFDVQT